ncbi:tandem-95 repeat protein, partial [Pseudomonas sp. BN417]|uniref:tandem-95 repeat protein n=1 Tax=Pseudomonas sp. BN417 TaxID=2567890 RepID=UPI0024563BCC
MAISPISFGNTPQANGDTFVYDSLAPNSNDCVYLDVMANDLGGKAKTLYSLDDGLNADGSASTRTQIQTDLLAHQTSCSSAYGASISIAQDPADGKTKVVYDAANLFASEAYRSLSAGELLTDSFTYAIRLGNGTLSWATATVKLYGVNDAPESSNGYGTTDEDTPIVGAALPGATDIDGDSVTYALGSTAAEHGTVTVHADGTFDFAPAANYYGTDSFSFVVKDGQGGISEYTYNLTINSVNDAAVLSAATVELNETNAPLSTGGTLTISDVDSSETFQAQSNVAGSYGHFSITTGGVWTFTADAAFNELNVNDSLVDTFQVLSA